MKPIRDADAVTVHPKFSLRIIWVWLCKLLGEPNGGVCPFSVALCMKTKCNLMACITIRHTDTWELACGYSYSTTNKMHLLPQIIYYCKTFYMFRTVFPSIIRSSKLRIQQQYMLNSCCCIGSFELLMRDGKTGRNM
jgi:hypothetical protein